MIINNNDNTQESVVVGEIKENKVNVDISNLSYLTTLLTTNLYSNPKESFLRETISNAWDSHKEAGVDTPILLEFGKDSGGYYIRIKDQGVGISPERFDKIYKCIGSSTKREDNSQIGGFGIGRFSALAVSNLVHITNTYNGICYKYLMYRDAGIVHIDEISTQKLEAHNGVEIKVYIVEYDISAYTSVLKKLSFFDSLYVYNNLGSSLKYSDNVTIKLFNERKIFQEDVLVYSNSLYDYYSKFKSGVLLGNVLYPINTISLGLDRAESEFITNNTIIVKCNIGDLDITPNREQLLYSEKTIKVLNYKIKKAYNYVIEKVKEIYFKDGTDFKDLGSYYEFIRGSNITVTLSKETNYNITLDRDLFSPNITFKGHCVSNRELNNLNSQLRYEDNSIIPYKYNYGTFYRKASTINPWDMLALYTTLNNVVLYKGKMDNKLRFYINKTYTDSTYLIPYSISTYRNIIRTYKSLAKRMQSNNSISRVNIFFINEKNVKEVARDLINKAKSSLSIISTDSIPQDILKEYNSLYVKAKTPKTKTKQVKSDEAINCTLYRMSRNWGNSINSLITGDATCIDFKTMKHIVYGTKDEMEWLKLGYYMLGNCKYKHSFIVVSNANAKKLETLNNCTHVLDFLNIDNKLVRKYLASYLTRVMFLPRFVYGGVSSFLEGISSKYREYWKVLKSNLDINMILAPLERNESFMELVDQYKKSKWWDNMYSLLDNNKMIMLHNYCFHLHNNDLTRKYIVNFIVKNNLDVIPYNKYIDYKLKF